jgi:cell division protein FtsI (penicillin-binding protein 3)
VFADPGLIHDPRGTAQVVAQALGLREGAVYHDITHPASSRFVYIQRGVPVATAGSLAAKNLPGIGFLDESRRTYPAGPLAAQVLGYVNVDGTPLAGLEYQYEPELAGAPGHATVETAQNGVLIPQGTNRDVAPVAGSDLVLTLDRQIQFAAQDALRRAVRQNQATRGSVIVMNPRTGEILAMASYPWFDPNDPASAGTDRWQNRSVTDIYEPGSVNKVITAAAALESGALTPSTRQRVPWRISAGGKWFEDPHQHATEQMTLGDIIAYSSNVGTIMTAERVGKDTLDAYFERFRLGQTAGLGFPGEARGILRPADQWDPLSLPTFAIGQGIAVSPLQMALVYATVANGGVWVAPKLVRGIVGPDGTERPTPPSQTHRVISERTAAMLTRMLTYGVLAGTGTNAEIPDFWVAGKTGTARKPNPNGNGYEQKYMASFIGFTPASDPALVVAAVLDSPATTFGGIAAAPMFQSVARASLARLRVSPAPRPQLPPHAIPLPR